jgi:hypothetical protein
MENNNFKWVITGHRNGHEIGKYVFIPPWEREDKPLHKSPPSQPNPLPDKSYNHPISYA